MNLIVAFGRKYRYWEHYFSVWSLGSSQKLLKTNQFLVSTIFCTIMNISFFSLRVDLFLIIAKEVNQIRNNVVCVVAGLVSLFCCALTTGRCNAFQHNLVNWKKSEFYGRYFQTMLFLVTMFCSSIRKECTSFYWLKLKVWYENKVYANDTSCELAPLTRSCHWCEMTDWRLIFVDIIKKSKNSFIIQLLNFFCQWNIP